ncbi:MAG TPA: DNRLRE domain-containing protein, partial [Tepidisphaeraceae bacterium]|nr:DNRLRE domain-containing protein [Tepidisphaeraceae bacterium]
TVSFVVPDQNNDMHDGTIAQADGWLKTNIDPYVTWAKAHNSLLVVTWDEDNSASNNRIPTILSGANLKNGTINNTTYTLHNLLRTIGDNFNAAPSGSAVNVKDITGVFTTDAAQSIASFQQGVNGYAAAHDTEIRQDSTSSTFGSTTPLVVDQDDNTATGNQPVQALVRFDNIIGSGAGQVPAGAKILSAKLNIHTGSTTNDNTGGSVELHRMLSSWDENSTWGGSFGGNGVDANNVDASSSADFTLIPNELDNAALFDVTDTVQAWTNGATNFGWSLLANSTDGWRFDSSEFGTLADRPSLQITYAVPEPSAIGLAITGILLLGRRRGR